MSDDPQAMFQRLYVEQQMLEQNLSLLQQNLGLLQNSLDSYQAGLSVLEQLERRPDDEDVLVSIGGALYINARLVQKDKVIRSIGAGVRLEQDLGEAKQEIATAISTLEKRIGEVQQEYERSMNRAAVVQNALQQIAAQAQSGPQV